MALNLSSSCGEMKSAAGQIVDVEMPASIHDASTVPSAQDLSSDAGELRALMQR
jgi:hypothetical protein